MKKRGDVRSESRGSEGRESRVNEGYMGNRESKL